MADLQFISEATLCFLLAGTLYYAVRLDRALRLLKRDRSMLSALLEDFRLATQQAEKGLTSLRDTMNVTAVSMVQQSKFGQVLDEDLSLLIDRGERLATRLGGLLRDATPPARVNESYGDRRQDARVAAERRPVCAENPRARSQAERDLLQALRSTR
jgi:hypothetical protein